MTLEPLRKHTRKNTDFVWSPEWEQSFQEVKQKQTSAPILIYYDPTKELVLQVENSKDGVGAVLMQDGRPLKYALRALTASERKWGHKMKWMQWMYYSASRNLTGILTDKNLEFKFLKGEKLVIADTLSRTYVKITHCRKLSQHIFS